MSDLLGSLNQAHNVVDDYTDSDNTSDSSLSPRNSINNTTTTLDIDETNEVVGNASEVEETTIENIEIIIEDISGN
jgi:hypothetical protein